MVTKRKRNNMDRKELGKEEKIKSEELLPWVSRSSRHTLNKIFRSS